MQLNNDTPFQAERAVQLDIHGNQIWVVIVKASFSYFADGQIQLAAMQEPIVLKPQYASAVPNSTLLRDNECPVAHLGTDVTLYGNAFAPNGDAVRQLDITLSVGKLTKLIRVIGHRYWQKSLFSFVPSPAEPFYEMPVIYENAYGGEAASGETASFEAFEANPIGKGFVLNKTSVEQVPLPNLETPENAIKHWSNQPYPACFGAIQPSWAPRKQHAGNMDDAWRKTRFPLPPTDFNYAFYSTAPADLIAQPPLRGGEKVQMINLHRDCSNLRLRLPKYRIVVRSEINKHWYRHQVHMDRCIIDTLKQEFHCVWGARLNCGTKARSIARTFIQLKRIIN